MQSIFRRDLRRVFGVLAVAGLALSGLLLAGGHAQAGRRVDVDDFMTGLACTESGGRYEAFNEKSGSYGKYQIMPKIWLAWAGRYLRDRWAEPSPINQEYVARRRILDLYGKHHAWRPVAHWWLTGNADPDESLWSRRSTKYVDKVMRVARLAASDRRSDEVPERCFPGDFGEPRIRTEPRPRVRVKGGSVNLRRAAGSDSRAFEVLHGGDRLTVLGRDKLAGRPWLLVGLRDGRKGWIAGWYTAPVEGR